MKRIVLLSDIHLTIDTPKARLDNLVETQFKKLEYVYEWAEKNEAIICQGGDYVDKPRSWYLLPLLTRFLMRWHKRVETYMVKGQHDTYYYSETSGPATVIGALNEADFLTILGPKPIVMDFEGQKISLYGASFGETVPTPGRYHAGNLLLTHKEISDQALFEGHRYYSPKGFLKRHQNYGVILAADIHRKFSIKLKSSQKDRMRYLVNTGPMLRASATTYNFQHKPGFYVWEPYHKLTWNEIPHEPADDILTRAHIEAQEERDKLMAEFTLKLKSKNTEDPEGKTGTGNYRRDLDNFVTEHSVSKEIAGHIYGALAEIDANDL